MCDTLKKWTNFASEIITIKTNSNMKKLVLTMVALVAMATTSFAQFSASQLQMMENVVNDYCSSYSVPSVSYSLTVIHVMMVLSFRAMFVLCQMKQIGIISQQEAILIHILGLQAIVQKTILLMHSTMVKAIQFIKEQEVGSTIIIAMVTRPMFQNVTFGNKKEMTQ